MCVYSEGQQVQFTVSLGIAQLSATISDHRGWIEKADQALYKSKESGRNRLTIL
jgi:diguanylate cyclase